MQPAAGTASTVDIDLGAVRAVRVLGRGAMGTVFLVAGPTTTTTTEHYALKVFDKRGCPPPPARGREDAARRARWEVSVLSGLAHPHLPSLLGRAETPDLLAWAMPYCAGGDLNELRRAQPDRVFSPAAVRFYAAELVSALAELHAAGIAYRDLKPENVLLRADGHVILTDFDLSRRLPPKSPSASTSTSAASSSCSSATPSPTTPKPHVQGRGRQYRHLRRIFARSESAAAASLTSRQEEPRNLAWYLNRNDGGVDHLKKAKSARALTSASRGKKHASFSSAASAGGVTCERSFSFVGTEEYVAPEVVRGDGHEFSVDWWALGVLVYEMAFGRTPFRGRNRRETFRNVLLREPEFSADVRRRWPDLTDLISSLLDKDPVRRLGFSGGADEVRAHPFFAGVAWDLLGEVSRPPYIPAPAEELVSCEGFGVTEYFQKLHQPPSQADESPEALPEF